MPDLKILAIDPGNFDTAYVCLEGKKINVHCKLNNECLLPVYPELVTWADEIVCEMIASYGMAVGASVFETCIFIGRLMQATKGKKFTLVTRSNVKLSICKSPRANDSNIRQALIDQFGAPGTKKNPGPTFGITADKWAALALAETYRRGEYTPYVFSHDRA